MASRAGVGRWRQKWRWQACFLPSILSFPSYLTRSLHAVLLIAWLPLFHHRLHPSSSIPIFYTPFLFLFLAFVLFLAVLFLTLNFFPFLILALFLLFFHHLSHLPTLINLIYQEPIFIKKCPLSPVFSHDKFPLLVQYSNNPETLHIRSSHLPTLINLIFFCPSHNTTTNQNNFQMRAQKSSYTH